MSLIKIKHSNKKDKVYFLGIPIYSIKHYFSEKNTIKELFDKLFYIYMPACMEHPKIFTKYKDIYKGKDVVLCATGPTYNYYEPIANAIHIGVNNAYKNDKVPLDYLFAQDGETIVDAGKEKILNYRGNKCKKFFGIHYLKPSEISTLSISQTAYEKALAKKYYFILHEFPTSSIAMSNANITTRPLNNWGSVSFSALDFILWTHPKRIYLVGCDNTLNGYFKDQNSPLNSTSSDYEHMLTGWKEFKKFATSHYPDIKIISINPIGLKGIFEDLYTQNYIESISK